MYTIFQTQAVRQQCYLIYPAHNTFVVFFILWPKNDRWEVTTPGWPLMLGWGFLKAASPQNARVLGSHSRVSLPSAPSHVLVAEKGNFPMGSTTKSDAGTSQQPAFDYIFFGRPFLPRVRQGDISTKFTAWMSKPFFCKNPCLESRGYFNATMLLCYQCKNILIFGSNHKTSLCCKTETVQVAKSAPLIPGCWCPAPVWMFGDPGVPKAGAGVSGRLGATARNPRKSQAPVGRWPLGWKHVSFENGFEDYCWEEMSKKFQLKERGSNIFKPR